MEGGGMFLGVPLHVHFPAMSSPPSYKYLLNARYVHGSGLSLTEYTKTAITFSFPHWFLQHLCPCPTLT